MPPTKRPEITKVCAQCGQSFTRPDWAVWRRAVYCSPDCRVNATRALPAEERAALMASATAKIRGSKRSHEDLCKRAATKQARAVLSGDEAEIMAALNARGLVPVPVYAVDKYNIDFAFPDAMVAVEYNGGNWHNTPKKVAEDEVKAAFLNANGWTLLVFPRLAKRRRVDSGHARILLADLVAQVEAVVHR